LPGDPQYQSHQVVSRCQSLREKLKLAHGKSAPTTVRVPPEVRPDLNSRSQSNQSYQYQKWCCSLACSNRKVLASIFGHVPSTLPIGSVIFLIPRYEKRVQTKL
jgi:hypothetical protein